MRPSINPRCPYCGVRHKATKSERCAELAEQEQADAAPAPTDNQHDNGLADRIRAEIPPLCWVLRSTSNTGPVCTDMIGGRSPGGYEWTPDMCCLPCRLRAVVDGPTTPTQET